MNPQSGEVIRAILRSARPGAKCSTEWHRPDDWVFTCEVMNMISANPGGFMIDFERRADYECTVDSMTAETGLRGAFNPP